MNKDQLSAEHRFSRRMRRRQWSSLPYAAPTPQASPLQPRPMISVVMPVFNHARYLRASIESTLLASVRYPLQLIVVNDGSTDAFSEVVAPFRNDPRVVIIEQPNAGIARALNTGFSRADGPLLSWTSADNRYRAGALDRLADYLLANPMVGLTFGNVQLIDDHGAVLRTNTYRLADHLGNDEGTLFLPTVATSLSHFPDNFINACFLYRSTASDAVGGYDPSLYGCEDYDYWLRISSIAEVAHVDTEEVLYEYRLHGDTLTATLEPPKLQRDVQRIVDAAQRTLARQKGNRRVTYFEDTVGNHAALVRTVTTLMANDGAYQPGLQKLPTQLSGDIILQFESDTGARSQIVFATIPTECSRTSAFDRLFLGDFDPLLVRRADSSTGRSGVLFAPHDFSPFLRRARGANFLAIDPQPGTIGVCGLFLERLSAEQLLLLQRSVIAPLLSRESAVTLALICSDKEERAAADSLFLQSAESKQLRIVDLSEESADPDRFQRSLTYVLSALDLVIAPNVVGGNRDLCRIVGLTRVAAAAGLSVLGVMQGFSDGAPELQRFTALLPNLLSPSPDHGLLAGLSEAMEPSDQRTLDQLLIEGSGERFLHRILSLASPVSR